MKLKLMAAAAAGALAAAGGASAQVPFFGGLGNGAYVAADVGYHASEFEGQSSLPGPAGRPVNWNFSTEDSWAGFVRLGYRFSPNFRVELEGGYRKEDIDSVRSELVADIPQGLCTPGPRRGVAGASTNCGPVEGEFRAGTLMLNGIYDFSTGFFGPRLVPFAGFGVGAAELHNKVFGQLSNVAAPGAAVTGTTLRYQNLSIDDTDRTWAIQGILGLAWELSPNLAIDLTGRYLTTGDVDFGSISLRDGPQAGTTVTPLGSFEGDYRDTSVSLGLRYTFAAPPPPPPPVTTPEPVIVPQPMPEPTPQPQPQPEPVRAVAREFVVYFPFDQSVLTPEAQTVVQEAASYAQQGNATQVQVVGHADTSGSARYNVRLSERRARAVADAMVGLGVNPGVITADWRGETQPAVSTGDGVREPLNRRTSINVNF